jgi:hypothetical protein
MLELIAADRQQELVAQLERTFDSAQGGEPLEATAELDAIPGALDRARARSAELREGHAVPLDEL